MCLFFLENLASVYLHCLIIECEDFSIAKFNFDVKQVLN